MKQVFKTGIMLFTVGVTGATFITGCANAPLRTEASTSGIRVAEEAGAAKVPQASLHLQLAREELESARAMAAKGDKEEARSMLSRAEADAELAIILSHEDTGRSEAVAAMARVRQLRIDNQ